MPIERTAAAKGVNFVRRDGMWWTALAESSDDYLMGRFAADDYAAFETLYGRHKDAVYRYFLRATDAASAADGHQETWSRVIAKRRDYRGEGNFRAYLFTIAHNVLMDQFRRRPPEAVCDVQAVADGSPERDAANLEAVERLKALIAALPAAQREALIMHREAGLTIREIARVTGIAEEGVKSRLRYAMAKLRRGMRDHV